MSNASSNRVQEAACGCRLDGETFTPCDSYQDAIPNRVQPGTFGPVFDAGVEEGKRQARHATPNSEVKLMDHEEAIRHLLDHYYGPARYFRNADIAIAKLAEVMGDE